MKTLEILRSARALVDTPEKWTWGTIARDASGRSVPFDSPSAVCFCAYGAVSAACDHGASGSAAWCRLREALPAGWPGGVSLYNDYPSTMHADILALFDRAIEAEETAIKALDTPA